MPVRLDSSAPQSWVKHSTTELPNIAFNKDKGEWLKKPPSPSPPMPNLYPVSPDLLWSIMSLVIEKINKKIKWKKLSKNNIWMCAKQFAFTYQMTFCSVNLH